MSRLLPLAIALWAAVLPLRADTIFWYSGIDATNLTSTGVAMDSGFHFELGVFANGFVPTAANTADWRDHWASPQQAPYNPVTGVFDSRYSVQSNAAPFTFGTKAYIWGIRGDKLGGEWILVRAPTWTWPGTGELNPFLYWHIQDATEQIVGSVVGGDMTSAAVAATWAEWQQAYLAGESLDGPLEDPDRDGTCNQLEYVFGSDPLVPGPPPRTPVEIVTVGGQAFLQITVPRRSDRPATLVVEVSADLAAWQSGAGWTVEVANNLDRWIVRDATAIDASSPRRFLRVRVSLP